MNSALQSAAVDGPESLVSDRYHCFSGAFADKPQLEEGDKVLLPSSAFEQLARLQIEYPMLFELRSARGCVRPLTNII